MAACPLGKDRTAEGSEACVFGDPRVGVVGERARTVDDVLQDRDHPPRERQRLGVHDDDGAVFGIAARRRQHDRREDQSGDPPVAHVSRGRRPARRRLPVHGPEGGGVQALAAAGAAGVPWSTRAPTPIPRPLTNNAVSRPVSRSYGPAARAVAASSMIIASVLPWPTDLTGAPARARPRGSRARGRPRGRLGASRGARRSAAATTPACRARCRREA